VLFVVIAMKELDCNVLDLFCRTGRYVGSHRPNFCAILSYHSIFETFEGNVLNFIYEYCDPKLQVNILKLMEVFGNCRWDSQFV